MEGQLCPECEHPVSCSPDDHLEATPLTVTLVFSCTSGNSDPPGCVGPGSATSSTGIDAGPDNASPRLSNDAEATVSPGGVEGLGDTDTGTWLEGRRSLGVYIKWRLGIQRALSGRKPVLQGSVRDRDHSGCEILLFHLPSLSQMANWIC
jgi:hypothetical protein